MKQMIAVRSNAYFSQNENKEEFELNANIELVIVYTNGKTYEFKKDKGLVATDKLDEVRMIVTPAMLSDLITELQLHQTKLENTRKNSDQINSLIKHITENK